MTGFKRLHSLLCLLQGQIAMHVETGAFTPLGSGSDLVLILPHCRMVRVNVVQDCPIFKVVSNVAVEKPNGRVQSFQELGAATPPSLTPVSVAF